MHSWLAGLPAALDPAPQGSVCLCAVWLLLYIIAFLFVTGLGFYSGRETTAEHSWLVAALHLQPGAPGP